MRAIAIASAALVLAATAHAGSARPGIALTASPASVMLVGDARQTLRVANTGSMPLVVEVRRAGFALTLGGRPRVVSGSAAARRGAMWLALRPRRVVLAAGASTIVAVASAPPRNAAPGDYPALVLLAARPAVAGAVSVRTRIGVTVLVRVEGALRHRLTLGPVRIRRSLRERVVELAVANRGNVVEWLRRGRLTITLADRRRVVARLEPPARELLPHSRARVELAYRGSARGPLVVRATLRVRDLTLRRSFRVRL